MSNPSVSALEAFAEGIVAQVKTVVTQTKTAAAVIFLCGALAGCFFHG